MHFADFQCNIEAKKNGHLEGAQRGYMRLLAFRTDH